MDFDQNLHRYLSGTAEGMIRFHDHDIIRVGDISFICVVCVCALNLLTLGWTELPDTLKNHKNIGFLSNTGQYPLKNQKATKPAFSVGPSSAHQPNAI